MRQIPNAFHSPGPETEAVNAAMSIQAASRYRTPDDVLRASDLSLAGKRAILASWASDLNAVESAPALRRIPGASTPVRYDDVLAALKTLDWIEFQSSRREGDFRSSHSVEHVEGGLSQPRKSGRYRASRQRSAVQRQTPPITLSGS